MPESTHARAGSYPSRRALREAERRRGTGRHGRIEQGATEQSGAERRRAEAAATRPPIPPVVSIALPDRPPVRSGAESPESPRPRRLARALSAAAGLCGAAILAFTFTASGLAGPVLSSAQAAASQQQHLGTGGSPVTAYELLAEVSAESLPADAPVTFTNYTDAAVQYPFADTVPLTDGFGERAFPVAGFHDAQDFAAVLGTPIQAIADGVVLEAGWAQDGCGFGLKLQHRIDRHDVTSRYCHMWADSHSLAVGDRVTVGQEVGRVGATGIAFGAHLHFALTVDGQSVDPMPFLLKYNRSTRD